MEVDDLETLSVFSKVLVCKREHSQGRFRLLVEKATVKNSRGILKYD
jgi:hypothetical protein